MANISAEEFYKRLIMKTLTLSKEAYKDDKKWTNTIVKEIILPLISAYKVDGKQIETSTEYYRIDVTGWTQRRNEIENECKAINMESHLWDLQIAIEHENKQFSWYDETCKLSYIKCPLRIVIGYGKENIEQKIKIAAHILKTTNAFTGTQQEFAIILGEHACSFGENPNNPCGYSMWVFFIDESGHINYKSVH